MFDVSFDSLSEQQKMHLIYICAIKGVAYMIKHDDITTQNTLQLSKLASFAGDKIDKIFEQINKEEADNV